MQVARGSLTERWKPDETDAGVKQLLQTVGEEQPKELYVPF